MSLYFPFAESRFGIVVWITTFELGSIYRSCMWNCILSGEASRGCIFANIQKMRQARVESAEDAVILGKFNSNGMDAKYFIQVDTNEAKNLASRLMCFSIPTVAIVRGHAVGEGCMFALPHDYRLMSSNHSFIFVNEVDIGMSLTPGNSIILYCKLSPVTYHEVVLISSILGRPQVFTTPLIFSTAVMSCITDIQATVKDLPDVEGDRLYGFKSLSITLGRKRVFWTCVSILLAMYSVAMVVGVTSSFVWTKGATTSGSHLGFRPSEGLTVKMVLRT
eukprot:Gb_01063 [translate_table: standard]